MKHVAAVLFFLLSTSLSAQPNLPTVSSLDPGWNTIPTEGVCSAGTPFQFYAKPSAASDNLLIFFNGGGACWFGQACDLASQPNIHSPFADMEGNNPAFSKGIFNFENSENPFADYDMVFIPYCTGDVHIGAGERNYTYQDAAGEETSYTAHHNGYENSMTALNWIYENFTAPNKVIIGGSSAGAIGSSFYSGIVAEHYSSAPVVLLADAGGGYRTSRLPVLLGAWNTAAILPEWDEYAGKTNDTLTFEDFYIASSNHSPNLTIAQYNAAEDETQVMFTQIMGDPPETIDLPQRILTNYQQIESAVDDFYSYTAGGPVHMILQDSIFYDYKVEGVRFVDWLKDLADGNSVRDISCVDEAAGCDAAPVVN